MADDTAIADLFDSLFPLSSAGINPDEAVTDRAGTMAKLLGPTAPKSWAEQAQDQYQAQNDGPDQANLSPNGNALPPGLNSRTASPTAAAATPTPDGPTAAVPASVTPSGETARPSLADNNAATIGTMQSDYQKASQDVQNEANQPDLASTTKNLESARQNAAQPINAYDPKTGKLVDEYKPTFGQRIMRGVEGFAKKGVIGAVDPAAAGTTPYGAPNQQYGRDLNSQGQRVASIDQQLKNAADNWKSQSDRLKAIAADRRSVVTSGEGAARASNEQQAVPIKQQEADTGSRNAASESQRVQQSSPQGKVATTQAEFQEAQSEADRLGLKGTNRTLYLANGKVPDPRQPTEDEIATSQATRAFTQQYGHPPQSLGDFASIRAAAKGQAPPMAGGNGSGASGEEFLKTLAPDDQNLVKSIANGDRKPPSASDRSPQAQALNHAVQNYDPSYTDARYKGKQQFKTGKDADDIVSLSTAMEHLENASQHSKDVGFAPLLGENATGDDTKYNKDLQLFSEETGRLIKSGVVTKEELAQLQSGLNSVRQGVRDSAISELTNLLGGKVSAKFQKYKTATGQDLPVQDFFDKPTQSRLSRFGVVSGGAPATPSGGASNGGADGEYIPGKGVVMH